MCSPSPHDPEMRAQKQARECRVLELELAAENRSFANAFFLGHFCYELSHVQEPNDVAYEHWRCPAEGMSWSTRVLPYHSLSYE